MDATWQIILGAAQTILTIAVWIYTWAATRQRAQQQELDDLRSEHEERLRRLEVKTAATHERMRHVPSADQLAELTASMRGLQAEVHGVQSELRTFSMRLERHEDFLMMSRRPAV